MKERIKNMLEEGSEVNNKVKEQCSEKIGEAAKLIEGCLKNNNKILLAGNGGSAEMCSHIAAEFTGRCKKERKALPAIALTTDLAVITAIGNDYGFEKIFERQLEAIGRKGDVLIALSTSGDSENMVRAVSKAKSIEIKTIGLLGKDGGKMKNTSDIEIIIPSYNTPRIQEAHLAILHIICETVEESF